ncbi:HD-GYP domain-containing protein [Aliikangiella sp. G2MR2-5]|uniref:HD-GYP domain-containing protein n=1 Tax=Aliikangiella sp. G2MR2-5 TaxID=2788943 RepID=UPI0018AA1A8E|nr:HD domain-containing phosphohydrolase [Aliikangiella sp. G2MR2-5]
MFSDTSSSKESIQSDADSLTDAGVYSEHLSEVNRKNKVRATRNIYNQNGVLLVAKGIEITPKIATTIAQHKLQKPIEHDINLEKVVNSDKLYDELLKLLENDDELGLIYEKLQLKKTLLACCEYYSRYNIIVQKITVMSTQCPRLYYRSLICSLLALAVCRCSENSELDKREAFVAALIRDMGFLHLPHEISVKDGNFTPEEEKAIKSHPLVAKLILDEVKEIPSTIKIAVTEHHERNDGTGYPRSKKGRAISLLGHLLAMCNDIQELCRTEEDSIQQYFGNLEPFIAMNTFSHTEEVAQSVQNMLYLVQLPVVRIIDDSKMLELLEKLEVRSAELGIVFEELKSFVDSYSVKENGESVAVALGSALSNTLIQSGLLSEVYVRWIVYVKESELKSAYEEMESVKLMHQELLKQFNRVVASCFQSKLSSVNEFGLHMQNQLQNLSI